jgi:hypothetical protein
MYFWVITPGYLEITSDYSLSGEIPPRWSKFRNSAIKAESEEEAVEILMEHFLSNLGDEEDEEDDHNCHLKIKPRLFSNEAYGREDDGSRPKTYARRRKVIQKQKELEQIKCNGRN